MPDQKRVVVGGVDTHQDNHVAAVVDEAGRLLGTQSFPASPAGYRKLLGWMVSFGELTKVGVEGTGSYGAGLTRHLEVAEVETVEVNRPNRQMRRRRGKSDTVDAESAARSALNGESNAIPKSHEGTVESIRAIRVAFTSMRNTRTRVSNQMHALIVSGPDCLREQLEELSAEQRAAFCSRYRPGDISNPTQGTKAALRSLGRLYEELTDQLDELRSRLDELTAKVSPALLSAKGVGSDVASTLLVAAGGNWGRIRNQAAFAALCGASPVQASSGRTMRHRLNRNGNRQANEALWRIVMIRMTCDPKTRAYRKKRTAEGKSFREIVRCVMRYVAREIYRLLVDPPEVPRGAELRADRNAKRISLRVVAEHFKTQQIHVSRIERGLSHDLDFAIRYRAWLDELPKAV